MPKVTISKPIRGRWRFNAPDDLIKAYYVDWDLLSAVQDNLPFPEALGMRIKLDSDHDFDMLLATGEITAGFSSGSAWSIVAGGISGLATMAECHLTDEVLDSVFTTLDDTYGF